MDGQNGNECNRSVPQGGDKEKRNMKWTFVHDEILLQIMVEQSKAGRSIKGGYTTEGWNEITKEMMKIYGASFSKDKLKNRFKTLKKTYAVMKTLLNLSGFGWCETRKMVTAEGPVWDDYLAAHPDVASYRTRILPDYYMLAEIFGDSVADGRESFAANDPNLVTDSEDVRDHEEPMIEGDTELLDDDFSLGNKRTRTNTVTPSGSRHLAKNRSNIGLALVGAVETIACAITEYANKRSSEHQPMLKCVEALDELELDDSVYYKVLRILEIGAKRETFMALGPLSRKGWLLAELGQE